eukprot:gene4471-4897_t
MIILPAGQAFLSKAPLSSGGVRRVNNQHKDLTMHLHHDHSHSHSHSHSHDHTEQNKAIPSQSSSSWKTTILEIVKNPKRLFRKPNGKAAFVVVVAVFALSAIIRRKLTKADAVLFTAATAILSIFDGLNASFKSWISKAKDMRDGIAKHSTPIDRSYFFRNKNLADRVTLLGVAINILLSVSKFVGGIVFNSAVLVADAGHSLSDLFSDFITLWAVQIARLPADKDHPYGHGKFESVGSLFLSLTLLATGVGVGAWSYGRMLTVLATSKTTAEAVATTTRLPSPPALALALISIVSKEWLFRITKRVGESLNSQILIANAWHHRSDSFSSVLSLLSIAAAIFLPGFLVVDSAAGILVACMICMTGFDVMMEAIKQLTDVSDEVLVDKIALVVGDVEGVKGLRNIRARSVGSENVVEVTVQTDIKLSTSASHDIAERARWKILKAFPDVVDVVVRTQGVEVFCPLLTNSRRSLKEVESEVRSGLQTSYPKIVSDVKRVTVHYDKTPNLAVEVVVSMDPSLSREEMKNQAACIQRDLLSLRDISQVEVQLDLLQ